MICFLTSSPCFESRDTLNPANGFTDQLRMALPGHRRGLMIASDPQSHDLLDANARGMAEGLRKIGVDIAAMDTLDSRNAENAPALVASADLIILSGGHVPTQNAFFHAIGLRGLLQDWDGVLMGISAGTMNCAEVVYAQPEEPGEALDPSYRRWLSGLGLTPTMILPHYQENKDDVLDGLRIYEDIAYPDSRGGEFLCLVDGSYLLIRDGQETIRGESCRIRDGKLTRNF